ncbi:MAG: hypothetical protein Q4D65_11115 [Peptostreptococcaceae bacterium]|nr:hypothetical protein [Peptostreptococcaceae bacterium]
MKYSKAKKIAALLLAGMIVLAGCGAKEQSTNEQAPNTATENQQKPEEKPEQKPEEKKEEKKEEKSEPAKTEDKKQEPKK